VDSPDSITVGDRKFAAHPERPRALLIAGETGIGAVTALAEHLRAGKAAWKPLVLLESESPFPFNTRPSTFIVPGMPPGTIACMPLIEAWGVPSRLASKSDFPGCFDGSVIELADLWLKSVGLREIAEVEIFCFGPTALVEAAEELARRYGTPYQQQRIDNPVSKEHVAT
jgi:dihydroorotate dehydrogenase electron transfer subunit